MSAPTVPPRAPQPSRRRRRSRPGPRAIQASGAAFVLVGVCIAGCGGGGSSSPTQSSTGATSAPSAAATGATPAPSSIRRGTPVDQDLTFSGAVSGHMTSALTQCVSLKSTGVFQGVFMGQVGDAQHALHIILQNFTGPGPYESTSDVLRAAAVLDAGGGAAAKAAVNADGKSGTVDSDIAEGGHVSGSWACVGVVNAP